MLLPDLVLVLTFFLIGILFWPLPTIWFYTGVPGAAYLIARWNDKGLAFSIGVAASLALPILAGGWIAAVSGQKLTQTALHNAIADDTFEKVSLDGVGTFVELVPDYGGDGKIDLKCGSTCQRVLFSGFADRYALGQSDGFDPKTTTQPVQIFHELGPLGEDCSEAYLGRVGAEDHDFANKQNRRNLYLSDIVIDFEYDQGLCFRSWTVSEIKADLVFSRTFDRFVEPELSRPASGRRKRFDWRLERLTQVSRTELFLAEGSQLRQKFRQTSAVFDHIEAPLTVSIPFNFNVFRRGGWAHKEQRVQAGHFGLTDLVDHDFSIGNE